MFFKQKMEGRMEHFALHPQKRGCLLGMGTGGEKGSTADSTRKRLERPWTTARTMEVLRRCPLSNAQRLVHCAIAVSNEKIFTDTYHYVISSEHTGFKDGDLQDCFLTWMIDWACQCLTVTINLEKSYNFFM